ncbi:hypothetical protein K7X08_014786 [Anisodus acutangulus]|uniref:Uncharacterized protein n=1 Tax=Anisodus acutangulus TaxID=402998 RepID=A0A9Q1LIX2_9SOLA|nr:hypothetical protein K7X08_014786 [Anisodus acutangulus]
MGAAGASNDGTKNHQADLMTSLIKRKKDAVVHSYNNGFTGFAERLSEAEAKSIAQRPGVISVFPDPILQLHTTRSWDFLQYQTDVEIRSGPISGSDNSSPKGADTIIGILDTVPSRWKGTCMESLDFSSSKCNKKLVGARFYDGSDEKGPKPSCSARDQNRHGTHVAFTAAGNPVSGASYYGLASGTAKGGSPGSRIAMYRVCTSDGCRGSAIMKAFDDAIADGVDVLSLLLGLSSGLEPEEFLLSVLLEMMAPDARSVVNVSPWILTVAATTLDRDFETYIVLGGNKLIKGGGISFGNLTQSPVYPLISGDIAKSRANDVSEKNARMKLSEVRSKGGIGFILVDDNARTVAPKFKSFPAAVVTEKDSNEILSYINSTKNPVASVLLTVSITKYKPAPVVAYFSSRGPSYNTPNLLEPDITAPGVAILAAWPGNDTKEAVVGQEPPLFNIISGTSMSCPHVSGIAAFVKAQNPSWSPSAIKSAIMTTGVSNIKENETKKVTRALTNVAEEEATYTASIKAPAGLEVQVIPSKLVFTNNSKKLRYELSFKVSSKPKEDLFGSITWTNGKYNVRSPYVVTTDL